MKPLLITSGEPAGIGPDLCVKLAYEKFPVVILGNKKVLAERAKKLGLNIKLIDYKKEQEIPSGEGELCVLSIPIEDEVIPGVLNVNNASYVLHMLEKATKSCLKGEFSALVTTPVHKGIINEAGFSFTGHTEFLADICKVQKVVMMLASTEMKVALITTHLPLKNVPESITEQGIVDVIECLNDGLQRYFAIYNPKIFVAGLNPHAGEFGYLGREEIEIIIPALTVLKQNGINVFGPMPADSMFTPKNLHKCDAFVAMYHDQGLTVLKALGFGHAVNITLGLPIIRVSVDHGTALEIAGTGNAEVGSLHAAIETSISMFKNQNKDKSKK